ncbi:VOC family protein [Gordonia aurantiaca]|uniref:VOC family protein n=1 Tax=Gordonia sp. B21 TaxID=3151852 RepID=UPI0032637A1A
MATATIGSMILSSEGPRRLAEWYAAAFEATIESTGAADGGPGYLVVDLDGFCLMFDRRDDVSGVNTDGARLLINVEVDDPKAAAARIDALGARWISPLEQRGGNWFGTVADPDGNWVQILWICDEEEIAMGPPSSRS